MNGALFSLTIYRLPVGYLTPSYSVSGLPSHRFIHQANILKYWLCTDSTPGRWRIKTVNNLAGSAGP
jgi:hypothetical protein